MKLSAKLLQFFVPLQQEKRIMVLLNYHLAFLPPLPLVTSDTYEQSILICSYHECFDVLNNLLLLLRAILRHGLQVINVIIGNVLMC